MCNMLIMSNFFFGPYYFKSRWLTMCRKESVYWKGLTRVVYYYSTMIALLKY